MDTKRALLTAGVALFLCAVPVLAHHSFRAEYDESRQITLNGTISKVIWKNPHVLVSLDVKEANGSVTMWELELASPNGLMSQGWKLDSLKAGDQISATGFAAKDGSHVASIRKVVVAAP